MPMARQRLHMQSEDIHLALWPSVKEMYQIASRHYAFEGRCFVVSAGGIMRRSDLPAELEESVDLGPESEEFILNGGSSVIGPDGLYVAGPSFGSEVIILARINLDRIREESLALDVTGHFNRPDLFDFRFRGEDQTIEMAATDPVPRHQEVGEDEEILAQSGTDGAHTLRVISSARTQAISAGHESEIHELEKGR